FIAYHPQCATQHERRPTGPPEPRKRSPHCHGREARSARLHRMKSRAHDTASGYELEATGGGTYVPSARFTLVRSFSLYRASFRMLSSGLTLWIAIGIHTGSDCSATVSTMKR